MNIIRPEIRRRNDAAKEDVAWERSDDMIQWLITCSGESLTKFSKIQLVLTFAVIDATTAIVTNIVYTPAAMPDCALKLRE